MTDLMNLKNEKRYITALQKGNGYKIPTQFTERLQKLFKLENETESKLLLLESAFSMIEQMWLKKLVMQKYVKVDGVMVWDVTVVVDMKN